jgi:hypothetical protein
VPLAPKKTGILVLKKAGKRIAKRTATVSDALNSAGLHCPQAVQERFVELNKGAQRAPRVDDLASLQFDRPNTHSLPP